ncbi:MAG: hypothetical protein ACE5K7_03660 [Phycisphaerae bacterium]
MPGEPGSIDFTDLVKGRHFYLIRFGLGRDSGLASLKLRTVTQLSRAVFPRLKDGGTRVSYQASGQAAIHGGPSQYLAERFRRKDLEQPGYRVYQITAPGPIRHAAGVARCSGPGRGPWSVAFSLDGGKTWRFGLKDCSLQPGDSDWGGGHHAYAWANMDLPENTSHRVLIRFGKGNILHCEVYATYERPNDSPLQITFTWQEAGQTRQHSHRIPAGKRADTWLVPTGKAVATRSVCFQAR